MYLSCDSTLVLPTSSDIPPICDYLVTENPSLRDYNSPSALSIPGVLAKEIVLNLAIMQDYKHGKWIIYRSGEAANVLWRKLDKACKEGRLDKYVRVTTHHNARGGTFVFCVYTRDFTNKEDVMKIRAVLRSMGVAEKIRYKPDIYTALGIYHGSVPGLAASLYEE